MHSVNGHPGPVQDVNRLPTAARRLQLVERLIVPGHHDGGAGEVTQYVDAGGDARPHLAEVPGPDGDIDVGGHRDESLCRAKAAVQVAEQEKLHALVPQTVSNHCRFRGGSANSVSTRHSRRARSVAWKSS